MKDRRGGEGLRSIFYLLLTSLVPFPEPNFPPRLIYRVTNGLPRQLYSRVAVTPLASSTARPPTRFIFRERERERSQRPSDRSASLNPPPPRAREDGRGSWGTFSSVELGRIGSGNGPLNLREAEGRFRIHGLFLESCINSTFVERHISEIVRSGRLSRADTRHTKRGRKRERRKVDSPCSFPSVRYSVLLLFVLVETIRRRWPNIEYRKLSREASEKLPQLTVVFSQRCNYGERRIEWGIDGGKICRCARSND